MTRLVDILARGTRRVLEGLDRPVAGRSATRRGVALIVALVTITVLAAAVTQYAYSSRVNLKMSVNAKDKVKSYFLARSAINLSHLLVNFQYSLQNAASEARGSESAQAGACNPGMISVAMRRSNFQIYQYMDLLMRPFNSGSLETPVGGIDLQSAGVKGFGKVHGKFDVEIEPESGKLNVNRFADVKIKQKDLQEFCALLTNTQYTQAFREQAAGSQQFEQYRLLRYIVDYIDLDETELPLTRNCTVEKGGGGSSESSRYADLEQNIEPRNAKLTHTAELYQVYGISDPFMDAYGDELTVYPVGKPNVNMADFPVFYSVLCRNTRLGDSASVASDTKGFTVCQKSPTIAIQVLYFALALDGVRAFFKDPISVLMAYVGSTQSRLLPSAKKGQPVAFLRSSQVHSYLEDFKNNPKLMAQFIQFSPAYRRMASRSRDFRVNQVSPNFPQWSISFNRTGIIRSVSTRSPSIYRITAKGTFGSTETAIETVIDFGKSIRKLPETSEFTRGVDSGSERMKELKKALNQRRKSMPKGRILYWREDVRGEGLEDRESGAGGAGPGPSAFGSPDAGTTGGPNAQGAGGAAGEPGGREPPGETEPGGGGASEWDFEFGN